MIERIDYEPVLYLSPVNSVLFLKGEIPDEPNAFGVSFDGEKSIVPFAFYLCIKFNR
jgi:hypothetical protein